MVERFGFRVSNWCPISGSASVPILYSLCVVAPWKSISNHALQSRIVTEIYLALQSGSQIVMQMFDFCNHAGQDCDRNLALQLGCQITTMAITLMPNKIMGHPYPRW
jgi:hypothetical protein